jgi:hypothetical protein
MPPEVIREMGHSDSRETAADTNLNLATDKKKNESFIPILTFCIQLIAVVERLVKAVCAITHMW